MSYGVLNMKSRPKSRPVKKGLKEPFYIASKTTKSTEFSGYVDNYKYTKNHIF